MSCLAILGDVVDLELGALDSRRRSKRVETTQEVSESELYESEVAEQLGTDGLGASIDRLNPVLPRMDHWPRRTLWGLEGS